MQRAEAPADTSVEWVTTAERLAGIGESWRALLGRQATPFDTPEWFSAWWSAFGDDGSSELHVATVWRGGELAAVLPLQRRGGQGLAALSNDHSPLFRAVAADAAALAQVVGAALGDGRQPLTLAAVPSDDPLLATLGERAARLGMRPLLEPAHTSPIVDTAGDPTQWRAASKPRWGAPLERFRRKMGNDHQARFAILEQPEDLDRALARGFEVEASGWKGEHGTAILSSPATTAFYRDFAHAAHARGELLLSGIELDGALAAFDLTVLRSNRLYLLKTGFDERFRKLAPGLVMRLSVIERCFELGVEAHELLGDDAAWKRKFATTERSHVDCHTYGSGLVGGGRYAYRTIARPLLKRARNRALSAVRLPTRSS